MESSTESVRAQLGRAITISGFEENGGGFSAKTQSLKETEPVQTSNKIFLKDFDIEKNEHFVTYVFIPYFKDIYKDLSERSDKKAKGINKVGFLEVLYNSDCNIWLVCKFTGYFERTVV